MLPWGPVAQWISASDFGSEGPRFNPGRDRILECGDRILLREMHWEIVFLLRGVLWELRFVHWGLHFARADSLFVLWGLYFAA